MPNQAIWGLLSWDHESRGRLYVVMRSRIYRGLEARGGRENKGVRKGVTPSFG